MARFLGTPYKVFQSLRGGRDVKEGGFHFEHETKDDRINFEIQKI
jgi:hypothetical protein